MYHAGSLLQRPQIEFGKDWRNLGHYAASTWDSFPMAEIFPYSNDMFVNYSLQLPTLLHLGTCDSGGTT